jgi:hypothetical protein
MLPHDLTAARLHSQASCGPGEVASTQLSETLRRLGRAVTLAPPDPSPALEAGLRALGLRDCSDAARAVSTMYRLAAMQLLPRCADHYTSWLQHVIAPAHVPGRRSF